MAKKLVLDENNKLKIKYSKIGKNASFFDGQRTDVNMFERMTGNVNYNKRYTEFGGSSLDKIKTKINGCVDELKKSPEFQSQLTELQTNGFLKKENLDILGKKELTQIIKVMSKMSVLVRDYNNKNAKNSTLNSPIASVYKQKYLEAFDIYRQALNGVSKGFSSLDKAMNFDIDAFAKDIDGKFTYKDSNTQETKTQESNLNASHIRDLEVVRALEFVGTNLTRTIDDKGNLIWKVDEKTTQNNKNGLEFLDENNKSQNFKLDTVLINSFLDKYLNQPVSARSNAIITADGIFKLYLEEANKDVKTFFGKAYGLGKDGNKMMNDAIQKAEEKYNSKGAEWNAYLKSSDRIASVEGTKLALMDLYMGRGLENEEELISDELQGEIATNNFVNAKFLNKLITSAEGFSGQIDSQKQNYADADNYLSKYTDTIKVLQGQLESQNLSAEKKSELQAQLDSVTLTYEKINAIREFASKVALQLSFTNKEDWTKAMNMLSETDVLKVCEGKDGYEISINENVSMLDSDMLDICKDVAFAMNNSSEQDIFCELFDKATENEANNLGNGIKEWAVYDFTDNFLNNSSPDNQFVMLIDKYRQARSNAPNEPNNASLKTFLENTLSNEDKQAFSPFCTIDSLSNYEMRTRSNTPEYQASDEYQNAMNEFKNKSDNANKFISMLVRTRSNMANLMPTLDPNAITADNYKNAYSRTIAEMNSPDFQLSDEEKQIAKLYRDYIQKAYTKNALEGYMADNNIHDKSTISKDMLNLCSKMFTNKELEKNIEDIRSENSLEENDNDKHKKEMSEAETKKLIQKMKFSEKYPKDKTAKLLKKFKPYCEKSTGKIIEKMMEMIEKCDIVITKKVEPSHGPVPPVKAVTDDDKVQDEGTDNTDNGENKTQDEESQKQDNTQDEQKSQDDSQNTQDEQAQTDREVEESKESNEKTSETKESNEKAEETQTNNGQFKDNFVGLPEGEYATFKILSLGLNAVLNASSFAKNRDWLSEEEKGKISALSKVMDYITKPSQYESGSEEYKKDIELKKFLADELDLKAKLPSDESKYNAGTESEVGKFYREEFAVDNVETVASDELIKNIYCVMKECRNVEDIGQLMCITTDLPETFDRESMKKFQIGNKLSHEDIEAIASCKNDAELWSYIRKNNDLYQEIWNVPGAMSQKLADYMKQLQQEEAQTKTQAQAQENVHEQTQEDIQNQFTKHYEEFFEDYER